MDQALKDWGQFAVWFAGVVSAIAGLFQYRRSVKQRMAESLMRLEERFLELKDIARLIDPQSGLFDERLAPVLERSLQSVRQPRARVEHDSIVQLDLFLRFLLLLSSLEKNRLLNRDSLAYMYHYWFRAVCENGLLRRYVDAYFINLSAYLRKNEGTFRLQTQQKP